MSNPTPFRVVRFVCVVAVTATSLLLAADSARAHGVIPPTGSVDPSTVDVEIAVAVTPFGATRWSRLTVGGTSSVMWLVPARPGAALDWATDAWLGALHDASTPRLVSPTSTPPCGMPSAAQRAAPWSSTGGKRFPRALTVHASEGEARAHVSSRGFEISGQTGTKIAEAYQQGYTLVSLELDTSGGITSTPTLRVSDDGGAVVPLAISGSRQTNVRVTAMVIGEGSALLPGASDLGATALTWGQTGSNFTTARASVILEGRGATWLRESASHSVLFDGVAVPRADPIEPVLTGYFREASGAPRADCDAAARSAGSSAGVVGRACAAGALARVPGGTACAPSEGTIDPDAFVCGPGIDDLAIALSGTSPTKTSLTRFTGLVPLRTFGMDMPITAPAAPLSAVVPVARYEPCPVTVAPPAGAALPGLTEPAPEGAPRPHHYERTSGACSGSATTIVYDDTGEEDVVADESCGASSTGTSSSTTNDDQSCGSSSETSSSSSGSETETSSSSSSSSSGSSGWDDDDTDSDDDSASDSDACSSSSSSSSSGSTDDSEATPTSLHPKSKAVNGKPRHPKTTRTTKRKGSSPVSRYALLFVALILPIRRSLRLRKL